MDGFPRHLSIHSGGMLITAAPLIDIAPLERATMKDRVVVQYDKRDVETMKLIKLDLLGLGMLAAIDETLQRIERDCATCLDLDRLPEEIPEVFEMLQAADTVGVFQVESRAQMQTLPKSRPASLDDLVVEVAIIRPGPIQGNAVHPYLRRKQGLEPVTYLHPSLEPVLRDSLGVILYQEQVMRVAIEVAGFSPADSDGFRRAMGTWRSTREMEKLHRRFVDGCLRQPGHGRGRAEELFRQVAAFASFGFAKSHAAAFARTAYESSFLKLFYPAQFLAGLINAQPMGFYPVEVLVNDAKRHGVAVLPVDINASAYLTTTEWVGVDPRDPLPPDVGIDRRPERRSGSPACVIPSHEARGAGRPTAPPAGASDSGCGLVKGIGEEHADRARRGAGERAVPEPGRCRRADRPARGGPRAAHPGGRRSTTLGRPRRELLWQLREVMGASGGRIDGRTTQTAARASKRAAGRPIDLRLPATAAPDLPPIGEIERLGDAYAVISLDARSQVIGLFRDALGRLGAVPNSALNEHRPGRGPDRWPGGHPAAPDDRQGHGLPGPRGRDRDGQRHPLAGRLGEAARRRPPPRAPARGRDAPARGQRGQRHRQRDPAAAGGDGRRRRPGSAAGRAPARLGRACAGSADARGRAHPLDRPEPSSAQLPAEPADGSAAGSRLRPVPFERVGCGFRPRLGLI